jgi:hypothetical protein
MEQRHWVRPPLVLCDRTGARHHGCVPSDEKGLLETRFVLIDVANVGRPGGNNGGFCGQMTWFLTYWLCAPGPHAPSPSPFLHLQNPMQSTRWSKWIGDHVHQESDPTHVVFRGCC